MKVSRWHRNAPTASLDMEPADSQRAKSAPQARIYLDNSTITGADVQPGFHPEARYEFKGTSTELILKT